MMVTQWFFKLNYQGSHDLVGGLVQWIANFLVWNFKLCIVIFYEMMIKAFHGVALVNQDECQQAIEPIRDQS